MKLSLEDGKFLIELARKTIEENLSGKEPEKPSNYSEKLNEKCGVFVTLNSYPSKELRGCIGHPYPTDPLIDAVMDSAVSASTQDPRFPPINKEELENTVIEITVLTPPELIEVSNPEEYPSKIKIGEDGLIVELGFNKGLLLPQVPVEWKWNEEEFLTHTCLKAGLAPDAWKDRNIKFYKFQGQIFAEEKPKGEVVEKSIKD